MATAYPTTSGIAGRLARAGPSWAKTPAHLKGNNVKKTIACYLIFGWYFAFQIDYNEQAKSTTRVGPFVNENQCKAELDEMVELSKKLGVETKWKKCHYVQES